MNMQDQFNLNSLPHNVVQDKQVQTSLFDRLVVEKLFGSLNPRPKLLFSNVETVERQPIISWGIHESDLPANIQAIARSNEEANPGLWTAQSLQSHSYIRTDLAFGLLFIFCITALSVLCCMSEDRYSSHNSSNSRRSTYSYLPSYLPYNIAVDRNNEDTDNYSSLEIKEV